MQVARSQDVRCMCMDAVTSPKCLSTSPVLVSTTQIQIDSAFCLWVLSGHWHPLFEGMADHKF